jgi:hypothetical protein
MKYNGWENQETFLVESWHMDMLVEDFAEEKIYHVTPKQLEGAVENFEMDHKPLSGLTLSLLGNCFDMVDWHELTDCANEALTEMKEQISEGERDDT